MINRISRAELALLFFNITGYTIAKAISPNSPFINNGHLKGTSFLLIILIEFSLFEFVFGHLLNTEFYVVTVLTVSSIILHIILDVAYKQKIELVSEKYLSYYSILFLILFVLLSITGLVYLFMVG